MVKWQTSPKLLSNVEYSMKYIIEKSHSKHWFHKIHELLILNK